jgi:hypothetical protein
MSAHDSGYRGRDLILNRKDVIDRPIVGLGPQVIAIRHADELGRHAESLARPSNAPLHHRADFELFSDFPDVGVLSFEREY